MSADEPKKTRKPRTPKKVVHVNFTGYENLYDKLTARAKEAFRDPDQEILAMVTFTLDQ